MNTTPTSRALALVALAALALAGCGGEGSDDADAAATEASSVPPSNASPATTAAPTTHTVEPEPTDPPSVPPTVPSTVTAGTEPPFDLGELQRQVDEQCDLSRFAGLPPAGGTPESVVEVLTFLNAAADAVPAMEMLEVPSDLAPGFERVLEASAAARDTLAAAEEAAAAGDVPSAERLVDRHIAHLWSTAGRLALMGTSCGASDPARAAAADLNVALDLHAEQVNTGFGSVWVSQKYGDNVVRVDPESGEIVATVEVGTDPLKLQPADGRMWVRTADAYVAIDAATNEIVATLTKADVGPEANRNFAVDGAMWICDGDRLHRYDSNTLEPLATIDLGFRCDFVHADPDLVIAWNTDEVEGESGTSKTAIIDPHTNAVLATIDLPIDVVWPAVLDDVVYFGGQYNRSGVVIDRDTWTVTETVELPDLVGGGGIASDGESVFVPTRGEQPRDVLVLDAETFEVVDTIEPLGVNGIAVTDGAVWVVDPTTNVLQRFDVS